MTNDQKDERDHKDQRDLPSFTFAFCILGFAFCIAFFDAVAVGSGLNEENTNATESVPVV
jgi:hypothetical protein